MITVLVFAAVPGAKALGQTLPVRIVQTDDGTLYVLKDGARHAVVVEPISDDELAAYADAGQDGAALLLAPTVGLPQAVSAGQQDQPRGDQPAAQPLPDQPAADASSPTPDTPAQVGDAAPCASTRPGAKPNATCPSQGSTSAPSAIEVLNIQGAQPGGFGWVSVKTAPGSSCQLIYLAPSARRTDAQTQPQTADDSGVATWSIQISATTPVGQGSVAINCGGVTITRPIAIGGLRR